jgi:hypothetical protein
MSAKVSCFGELEGTFSNETYLSIEATRKWVPVSTPEPLPLATAVQSTALKQIGQSFDEDRRILMEATKQTPAPSPQFGEASSSHGVLVLDDPRPIVSTLANQGISQSLHFAATSTSTLYAPTLRAPHGACIEVVTAYRRPKPQVWAWDWCHPNKEHLPAAAYDVTDAFRLRYVRNLGAGFPHILFRQP